MIAYLLTQGADPNIRNRLNETPLFWAVASSDTDKLERIDLLLKAGADPNARAWRQQTPLMYFGWLNHRERNRQSAQVARRLHAAGANLNLRDEQGKTALLRALWGGTGGTSAHDFDLAVTLIDLGADVNVVENDRTALDYAKMLPSGIYREETARLLGALTKADALTAAEIAAKASGTTGDQVQ